MITSKFHTTDIFVIFNIQTVFMKNFYGCLCCPFICWLIVITNKLKAKYEFNMMAVFFYILQKNHLSKSFMSVTTLNFRPLLSDSRATST